MEAHDGDLARRPIRRRRRPAIAIAAVLVIAAALLAVALGTGDQPSRDTFYTPPDPLANEPGTLLRSEPIARPPAGTRAYRILYSSRGAAGRPAALSALLVVPVVPPPSNGRNVVAFTHGTVGVDESCAVSRGRAFLPHVDGLARFVRAGYVVVVPDYEGLGTAGPHPYLVGTAEARATLDAVRATQHVTSAEASARFVAWGVGQGGHAALFTAQEADGYAPELDLAGVAAGAPMANLRRLVEVGRTTPAGRVVTADLLASWSRVYPQLRLDDLAGDAARATIERVAKRCLPVDHARLGAAVDERSTALDYRTARPWNAQPWRGLLVRNSPGAKAVPVPVVVTQGTRDTLVRPSMTARFVRYLCSQGTAVQYRASRRVAHSDVGEKTAPYVARWIARRFAGERAPSTC